MKALSDLLRSLTVPVWPRRRSLPKKLQTQIWLNKILLDLNITLEEFWEICFMSADVVESSGLERKWLSGLHYVRPRTVRRIARKILGSDIIYFLPLWELLEDRPLTLARWNKLMAPFIHTRGDFQDWRFPNDDELIAQKRYSPTAILENAEALFERGDLYGFMAIVALVRRAEIQKDADNHPRFVHFMYRALPAVAKMPEFHAFWEELFSCLTVLHWRVLTTTLMLTPLKTILKKQIEDPRFEPLRVRRSRDEKTHRFIELEDPVAFANFPTPKRRSR